MGRGCLRLDKKAVRRIVVQALRWELTSRIVQMYCGTFARCTGECQGLRIPAVMEERKTAL